jgi:hypothetical protein
LTPELEESMARDERAIERIASALERWATVAEKRFAKDFPEPKVKRDAELIRADDSIGTRAEQYSDKAGTGWLDEQPAGAEPSRFEKRFSETGKQETTSPKRRVVEVPKGDGNKTKPS